MPACAGRKQAFLMSAQADNRTLQPWNSFQRDLCKRSIVVKLVYKASSSARRFSSLACARLTDTAFRLTFGEALCALGGVVSPHPHRSNANPRGDT